MESEGAWTHYERRVDAAVALGCCIEWNDGREGQLGVVKGVIEG